MIVRRKTRNLSRALAHGSCGWRFRLHLGLRYACIYGTRFKQDILLMGQHRIRGMRQLLGSLSRGLALRPLVASGTMRGLRG